MAIFNFIIKPLGYLMNVMYNLTMNYGFTIILFTLLTKVILLPLSLKQQKSTLEMQRIKPHMDELQKKYKDNKEKLNAETMKLYQEHGINPLAGCLPMLLQLPILLCLYQVISKPLSNMIQLSAEQILAYTEEFAAAGNVATGYYIETFVAKFKGLVNFNFLGMDLAQIPHFDFNNIAGSFNIIWIVPVLAAVTTYLSSKYMSKMMPVSGEQAATNNTMNLIFPVMTLVFGFSMPAGLAVYWIASNLLQMLQQYVMTIYFIPKMKEGAANKDGKKNTKNSKDS